MITFLHPEISGGRVTVSDEDAPNWDAMGWLRESDNKSLEVYDDSEGE